MCDSTSSALVTTIPQVYGTLLSDSAWTLNMRFRSFIWPDNLPHNLIIILLDVMSVDPCNASNERLVNSEIHNPLSNAENFKFKK
ncbi:hypothetical protein P9112_009649 [Eukaryota sp. TZLM1-RC]